MKWHQAKDAKEAAKNLPVGFISHDVKKEHEATPSCMMLETKPVAENVTVGFVAMDVKKWHTNQ